MEEGEAAIYMAVTKAYDGFMIFIFENGKIAKVEMNTYETKTNRKKLVGAYSDKSPLFAMFYCKQECEILLTTTEGRMLLVNTAAIQSKTTRSTKGVAGITLKRGKVLVKAERYEEGMLSNPARYRKNIPAIGALPTAQEYEGEQLTLK